METNNYNPSNARRAFLGKVAAGIGALGLSSVFTSGRLEAKAIPPIAAPGSTDEWFSKIKGKHKMVFDATQPHNVFPFAWPKVFLMTNELTGVAPGDCGVVVVLRHSAICYALESSLWEKYSLGEHFNAPDPKTQKPATRNPFWEPKEGDFAIPGIGNVQIGINELQASGVLFCVCDMAMTVNSAAIAKKTGDDAAVIKKAFTEGVLPGIQIVPSGVLALGRAQQAGCGYCFAG
jgi:hypothetical protein